VKFHELEEAKKSLTLYNHWLLHYDDMDPIIKRRVIEDMKKESSLLDAFNLTDEQWNELLEKVGE